MFRFTIRDMLWLMVVVGLGVTLVVEHRRATLATMAWHYWEQEAQPKVETRLLETTSVCCHLIPLRQLAQHLSDVHDIPIALETDVDGDIQITCNEPKTTLRDGLTMLLSAHKLAFRVENEAVVIHNDARSSQP
jgi:hypothetical protein